MSTGAQAGQGDAAGQPGAAADPLVGRVLADTYRVTRLVGEGGMGSVYEAAHVRLPKRFAVKFLHKELTRNQDAFARFQREAELASSLGNRHIVEVVDFNYLPDGAPYMVMEFLEGEGLAARLERLGSLPPREVLDICAQVVSALTAAHRKQVVHRDLKPDNIFLCPGEGHDFVKLLDFGVSKIRGTEQVLTRDLAMLGTPAYMSPEAARGDARALDHRADVYALGAVVYEMLTGRVAFGGETVYEVVTKIATEMPPPVHEVLPSLPEAVDGVLRRALSKDMEGRQDSAAEFLADLTVALESAGAPGDAGGGEADHHPADLEGAPTMISEAPELLADPPPPLDVATAIIPTPFPAAPEVPGPGYSAGVGAPPLAAAAELPGPAYSAGAAAPPFPAAAGPPGAGYGFGGDTAPTPLVAGPALPPDQRATDRMPRVAPSGGRLVVVLIVVLALVAAGIGVWLFLRPALEAPVVIEPARDAAAAATPATEARDAPETPPASQEAAEPPAPARVRLTLQVTPANARVLLDGDAVVGHEVVTERSASPRRIEASAPHYLSRTVEVVPSEDRVVRIELRRAHARHARPKGPPPKPRTIVVPPRP